MTKTFPLILNFTRQSDWKDAVWKFSVKISNYIDKPFNLASLVELATTTQVLAPLLFSQDSFSKDECQYCMLCDTHEKQ